MPRRLMVLVFLSLLATPTLAHAAHEPLDLPVWSVAPFVLLLLAIAVLPLVAEHWWHKNRNKAIVSLALALPTAVYLYYVQQDTGQPTFAALGHELFKYVSFICLLGSLYTVSGGIHLSGDIPARPTTNTAFLALGCVLANLIGTTGASVLLIRPLLRINQERHHVNHLPVFFIFTVSNLAGLLTPLGDPPLFLGFLHGVPFFWTLQLWPQWLLANGAVLTIFLIWDIVAYRRESKRDLAKDLLHIRPMRMRGLVNFLFLGGILGGVLMQRLLPEPWGEMVGAAIMVVMAGLSLAVTPRHLREANQFSWGPIIEVAILFLGIFVTMVPAIALLTANRDEFAINQPWQFFWLTGSLSAFLDNAPTYLVFATMAAGSDDFLALVHNSPLILQAISCGAVFMGAMTYIGNGPNFMVKAIADQAGYKTPTFFGYLLYSCLILLPIFGVVTWVFFWP